MKTDISTSLQSNTIEVVKDHRSHLYYNKYQYRAKLRLRGIRRTWYAKDLAEFKKRINDISAWKTKKELEDLDFNAIGRYIDWRNIYFTPKNKKDKKVLVRIEGEVASIFSNDLNVLKTLESIDGLDNLKYSEIDICVESGVKYFVHEPKYKYRVYFKSRHVEEKFRENLAKFIDRYKATNTTIVPCTSLRKWLSNDLKHNWYSRFCSSHYFIDFNDEGVNSLISIMFGDMIKARFKLEKRLQE